MRWEYSDDGYDYSGNILLDVHGELSVEDVEVSICDELRTDSFDSDEVAEMILEDARDHCSPTSLELTVKLDDEDKEADQ